MKWGRLEGEEGPLMLLKPALQRGGRPRARGRKEEPKKLSWRRTMGWFSSEVEDSSFMFRPEPSNISIKYRTQTLSMV